MKKLFAFVLCIMMLLLATGCGKSGDNDKGNARLSDIPTATADVDGDEEGKDPDEEQDNSDEDEENPDRNEETDREEIKNNLRDARELIKSGDIEDAAMIIRGLLTRDLTADEEKQLKELQKQMLKVSD